MRSGTNDKELLFRAIGETVVSFQQLELILSDVLCSIIGLNGKDHMNIVGASMSFRQKVDLYAALQRKKLPQELIPLCRSACTFLQCAEDFRNTIVHANYSVAIGKKAQRLRWIGEKANIRGAAGVKHRKKIVKIEIIQNGAEAIREFGWRAMAFASLYESEPDLAKKLEKAITTLKRKAF